MSNEKYVPYCIEPSLGADRVVLAFLSNAYDEETLENNETRVVLRLHPALAPFKAALQKKLGENAAQICDRLAKSFNVDYDETGSIGKRYRRQDEIGTPFCITVDFQTLEDDTVTVRMRDSMEQIRIKTKELEGYISQALKF